VSVKPMPWELLEILRAACESEVSCRPDDYVIPNRRPASMRRAERSDKVIWESVLPVAEVRDLSWGSGFQSNRAEAHTGFEPVPPP
jgi:hypothetical protein